MKQLERVEAGFRTLDVDPEVRTAALENLRVWLREPAFADYLPQLDWLIAAERMSLLLDSFYQVMPFGTGGRRGAVGPGPNRFNTFTLASSVVGHVAFLKDRFGDDGLKVVITYDTRCFNDMKGLYGADVPDPLRGITSEAFAELAARVYTSAGVQVYLAPPKTPMATPELSFAIRTLSAHGGLNVSASHNPPDDNGGKFYDHLGGQAVPPLDQQMVDRVQGVTEVHDEGNPALQATIPADVDRAYLELNQSLSTGRERGARVVYTPLHGVGERTVARVLRASGFEVTMVPGQSDPDGSFPDVPFGVANPEEPSTMDRGVQLAAQSGAELVLATDPDADRIGCRARDRAGHYVFLSGNEIGALVIEGVMRGRREQGTLPARPLVMRTEVTSSLITRVARDYGAQVIDHLLVGFKYVAAVLDSLESRGCYGEVEARPEDFVGAIEESHGALLTPAIRDKDAAGPALVLAELAAGAQAQGGTLVDTLEALYCRVGYVANRLTSMVMKGAKGQAAIAAIQAALRASPPSEVGGRRVVAFRDHWDESPDSTFGPIVSETDRAARNVLVFHLEGDARLIIRPSGTEPKNKTYVEVGGSPVAAGEDLGVQKADLDAQAAALEAAFVRDCLGLIGVALPDWGYRISGLVPLDAKQDFTGPFLAEFDAEAAKVVGGEASLEALQGWIDRRLAACGRDPRWLMADAFQAYLEAVGAADDTQRALRAVQAQAFELSGSVVEPASR